MEIRKKFVWEALFIILVLAFVASPVSAQPHSRGGGSHVRGGGASASPRAGNAQPRGQAYRAPAPRVYSAPRQPRGQYRQGFYGGRSFFWTPYPMGLVVPGVCSPGYWWNDGMGNMVWVQGYCPVPPVGFVVGPRFFWPW